MPKYTLVLVKLGDHFTVYDPIDLDDLAEDILSSLQDDDGKILPGRVPSNVIDAIVASVNAHSKPVPHLSGSK